MKGLNVLKALGKLCADICNDPLEMTERAIRGGPVISLANGVNFGKNDCQALPLAGLLRLIECPYGEANVI